MLTREEFDRVDIRAGTVLEAKPFPEARKPAFQLRIDFGEELGVKQSSAQITAHYTPGSLVGRRVLAVVNFPPMRIAGFKSEVLTLGFSDANDAIVLASVDDGGVPNGARMM